MDVKLTTNNLSASIKNANTLSTSFSNAKIVASPYLNIERVNDVLFVNNLENGDFLANITKLDFSNSPNIEVIPAYLFALSGYWWNAPQIEELTLPEGLTSIGRSAFSNWMNTKKINFPQSLEYIDVNAFYGWSSLEEVTFPPNIFSLESSIFQGCSNLKTVYFTGNIPEDGSIYKSAFNGTSITDIYVPWAEGEVDNAPWGATDATIHYNYIK